MLGLSQNSPLEGLTYAIKESRLAPGDTATLRLTNRGSSAIKYDLCQSWAERQTSTKWEDADIRVADACFLLAPRTLNPGETTTYFPRIDSGAASGTYRFRSTVRVDAQDRPLFTGPFRVVAETNESARLN